MRRLTWDSLVKRLAGIAQRECANRGMAIVSLQVIVDANGEPVFWTEPHLNRIEPRVDGGYALERIVHALTPTSFGKD